MRRAGSGSRKGSGLAGLNSIVSLLAQRSSLGDNPLLMSALAPTQPSGGARALHGRPPAGNAVQLAKQMAARQGWTGQEWRDLRSLWNKESGFNYQADNPTSSAYGIPQAMSSIHDLPKNYMNSPRAQIRWGLDYIRNRYGNPSQAWGHSERKGWY